MTQDVYLGRRAANAGNVAALEAYNPDGVARAVAPQRRIMSHSSPHSSPTGCRESQRRNRAADLGLLWAPWDSNPQPAD